MAKTSKKYEFTGETRDHFGRTLHQIRAVVAIASLAVSIGDLGGWIESEENLNHVGAAWVYPRGIVCGRASIRGGTIWGGTIEGGTIEGGTIEGGTIWGGTIRGGTETKIQPLFVAGLAWPVTITDNHMTIGCQHHALADWWGFDDARIASMDRGALKFWRTYKPMFVTLCETTARVETVASEPAP